MFPIATLPVAAILLRMSALIPGSSDDVYTSSFSIFIKSLLEAGSNAVFGPALPFIFAVGVAFGLSKDKRGEVALAGMIGMILMTVLLSDNQPGAKSLFGSVNLIDKFYGNIDFGASKPTILTELSEIKPGEAGYKTVDTGFYSIFGSKGFDSAMSYNVLNGIIVGSIVAYLYNKFSDIELPKVLGFFSGRRLVPVIVIMSLLVFGVL
jgi:N-acetylglucosamine PTS system EIICBA or EIICB component